MAVKQGPYAAAEWAFQYVTDNMGKGAKTDVQQKTEAKAKAPAVNGSSSVMVNGTSVKSWDDLMKLDSKVINKFCKENNKEFTRLKYAHFK